MAVKSSYGSFRNNQIRSFRRVPYRISLHRILKCGFSSVDIHSSANRSFSSNAETSTTPNAFNKKFPKHRGRCHRRGWSLRWRGCRVRCCCCCRRRRRYWNRSRNNDIRGSHENIKSYTYIYIYFFYPSNPPRRLTTVSSSSAAAAATTASSSIAEITIYRGLSSSLSSSSCYDLQYVQ